MGISESQLMSKGAAQSKASDSLPNMDLEVIAAGLPRCATSSLKDAFENKLGIGQCMHMNRCVLNPELMKLVHDAILEKNTEARRAILRQLFSGCSASADFPGLWFLEDLVEMCPNAKFILNVRKDGAAGWVKSIEPTIGQYMDWKYFVVCMWSSSDRWHYRTNVVWNEAVREKFRVEKLCSIEMYDRYNAWVRELMSEKGIQLFEWEPSMGWLGLCNFLRVKVPSEGFPRKNDQKHMTKVRYFLMGRGVLLWMRAFAMPAAAYCAASYLRWL
jgi:Sulfotransferase domain